MYSTSRDWWNCSRRISNVLAIEIPILPPRLRATLISDDACPVFSGSKPEYAAVVIGTNRKGKAKTCRTRIQANCPKVELGLMDVEYHIAAAKAQSAAAIRYRGWIIPDIFPDTGIINSIASPPGINASPDNSAVY